MFQILKYLRALMNELPETSAVANISLERREMAPKVADLVREQRRYSYWDQDIVMARVRSAYLGPLFVLDQRDSPE